MTLKVDGKHFYDDTTVLETSKLFWKNSYYTNVIGWYEWFVLVVFWNYKLSIWNG
jgi:hypothetical protein